MFSTSLILTRLAALLPVVCLTMLLGPSTLSGQSNSKNSFNEQPSIQKLSTEVQKSQSEPVQMTLTVDMDDNKLAVLRKTGLLRVAIPARFQGRVDAVRLRRPVSFKSENFELTNAVDKLNNTITVNVDDALLDQLDFQPIKAKVYYSGFSSVALVYTKPKPGDPLGLTERENKPTLADSTRFFARVDDQRGVYGWMTGLAKLKLKSDFGDVLIDTTDIAGIKFNANGSGSVSVRLNSGASVSGYVDFDEITMKCSWGTQKLALSELDSVVANRNYKFAPDPYHPGRWSFETDLVKPPEPAVLNGNTVPAFATPIPSGPLPYNP